MKKTPKEFCTSSHVADIIAGVTITTLLLLISYTSIAIRRSNRLSDEAASIFEEDVHASYRPTGFLILDLVFFSISVVFIISWYFTRRFCYVLMALIPMTISWSILLATVLTFASNDVDTALSSRSLACNEVELSVPVSSRNIVLPFRRANVTSISVVVQDRAIDESLCLTEGALARITFIAVSAIITALAKVLKDFIDKNIDMKSFDIAPACNLNCSCNFNCGEQRPSMPSKDEVVFYDSYSNKADIKVV